MHADNSAFPISLNRFAGSGDKFGCHGSPINYRNARPLPRGCTWPLAFLHILLFTRSPLLLTRQAVVVPVAIPLAIGSLVGAFLGAKVGVHIPEDTLKKFFGVIMIFLGGRTISKAFKK